MSHPAGEMPFLDHLEELRVRILRMLLAVIAGVAAGLVLVQQYNLVSALKVPIAPYLPTGKLAVLSPTEPVMIVLKLGFILGLVLASPVIIWQLWAFVAPALYEREKKAMVPALFVGLGLFLTGAGAAYAFVLPQALRVLFSFQSDALVPMITYDQYFSFVLQVTLGLGLSFELPLVMTLLAWLGVVSVAGLNRFRRFAVVLACVAGALLSPGADVLSMLMMTIPLLALYEVGVVAAVVIERRRRRAAATAAAVVILLAAGAGEARAQQPVLPGGAPLVVPGRTGGLFPGDTGRRLDSLGQGQKTLDASTAKRLGIPTAPVRKLPPADSVVAALLNRRGYVATRFMADSATLFAQEKRIELVNEAMTEREQSVLEAGFITYREADCQLSATGDPHLFDKDQVVVGRQIRYDTCVRRGVVNEALTNFRQGGTTWFLRGSVAQDSASRRVYAASSEFTSCDLPVPHYHFGVREVKWISQSVMVARPAVLYVRDVPVLWLPFVVQDGRPGRRSGILVPQFGINDIVRPNPGYNRQVTNIGFYWATNDYMDVTFRLDWFANRYTQVGAAMQYRWLDRFLDGNLAVSRQMESGGSSATRVQWGHRQRFSLASSLNVSLDYVTDTRIVSNNAIDPVLNTRQITSSANFARRFRWGLLNLGGNRRQNLGDGSGSEQFPTLTLSPKPLDFAGGAVTWSPNLSFTRDRQFGTPLTPLLVAGAPGQPLDTLDQTGTTRTMRLNLDTPVRLGSFNWQNRVTAVDRVETRRDTVSVREPNLSTPNPDDSVTVTRIYAGDYASGINWDTAINLPVFFRTTWRLTPSLGIANASPDGDFIIRNRRTNGEWVAQGKRFALGLSSSPSLFAFFPGFLGMSRIRHSFSPLLQYAFAPSASVPLDYAIAVARPGQAIRTTSDQTQTVSVGMNNVFEAKGRPTPGDTSATPEVRKFRLLSIGTSPISYDFEQAKKPGRTGWASQSLSNSLQSDLLAGFNVVLTHDLWRGTAGSDTAKFSPFLQSVSASFALTSRTFAGLGRLLGLGPGTAGQGEPPPPTSSVPVGITRAGRQGAFFSQTQAAPLGRGFNANVNFSLSRTRPVPGLPAQPTQSNVGFSTSFAPTPFWFLNWQTQYNFAQGQFESHVVRLERALHEWRASFNFIQNANGNFAFYFQIALTDLPELKFDYNQTVIGR